jgi:TP901 family phage tail tape measure protein
MAAVRQDLTVAIKLNDQFSGGLRDIQRETSNTFDENKSGSFLSGIKASTVALGAMAVGGLAAVGAGLKSSFDLAREFEQSMADVGAITGATGTELQSLSDLARDMGAVTAHSATSAAEGIQFLGMAGFDTNQIMDALPATLNLASAAGMELGAAADISSNILSGMGMNAGDLDGVVDKLAQTSRNANTDVGQLGEAFKMVGPTASAAGVSFDDTTVSLGLLANAGLQGSIGGSSLNSALRSMIAPSKEAAREAARLGLTFTDTEGKMLPMSDILTQLDENSVSTKDSFKIFGTEGARAINALRAQGVRAFSTLDAKIKESGGVAQDMADTRLGSFDGAMTKLSSAMSEFGISVGETFLPIVTKIVDEFLIPAVTRTNEFIASFGGIDTMFRDALTFVVGFKNTALNVLRELFNNPAFAEEFLGNIGSVFSAALGVVSTFAFGTTGRGGMVGIITELAKIVWAPLKQGFLAIWDAIKIPLVEGVNFMQRMFTDGINGIIRSFNSLAEVIGVSIDEIDFTPMTVDAPKSFQDRWAEGTAEVRQSFGRVGDHVTNMQTGIAAETDKMTSAIQTTAESASHLVDKGMDEVVKKYEGAVGTMKANAKPDGEAIGGGLSVGAEEAFDPELEINVGNIDLGDRNSWSSMIGALPLADVFSQKFSDVFDKNGAVGQAIVGGLKGITEGQGFGEAVAGAAQGIGQAIGGPLGMAITTVATGVLGALAPASLVERKQFGGIAEEVAFAVEMGGIGKLSMTTDLGRGLRDQQGKYSRRGRNAKQQQERSFASQLQEQFGKDREGQFYLNYGNASNLAAALLSDEIYGDEGVRFTELIRDVIIKSTADQLVEDQKRKQFQEMIGEAAMSQAGIVPAANGYNGMVSEPTLFLAGEAGPEMVDITPSSRMSGGFSGSGGSNFHFNFSVNTIDEQGVRSFIEQDAKPFIVQMLNRESTRGSTVMYSTGLTTDPSV